MLKHLKIQDFVLIDFAEVEPGPGLNIITGETGAGKSILIDALSLLLGDRASTESVRSGSQKTVIEGTFITGKNKRVNKFLQECELDSADELILRREVSAKGQSRCFINDTPVNVTLLKECGNLLVDLHGQHDHQSLLNSKTHIDFLDQFIGESTLTEQYAVLLGEYERGKKELKLILEREAELKEKTEFYRFQLQELDAVAPRENEDTELQNEIRVLENAETLLSGAAGLLGVLYDNEDAVYSSLSPALKAADELARMDDTLKEMRDEIKNALVLIADASETLRDYAERVSLDEEKLEQMRTRFSSIQKLKKKYGGTLELVLAKQEELRRSLDAIEGTDSRKEHLREQIAQSRNKAGAIAEELSTLRKKAARELEKTVPVILNDLGIKDAVFKVQIERTPASGAEGLPASGGSFFCNSSGIDTVEFLIATNAGEGVHPLHKTASGGEISRVMLALKSALANTDKLPLLIFDEIDTGVSGRIANKVGEVMYRLSGSHQIIAITHLPQIAALADYHFSIRKEVNEGRSYSRLHLLTGDERTREVASLMSGETITEAALKGAEELMSLKGQLQTKQKKTGK